MATSYSPNIGLAEMTPGDPAVTNSWGAVQNAGQISLIDTAIAGQLSLSVAGAANVVLTVASGAADQARNAHFIFTGALTGNIIVLWPAAPRASVFSVFNNTTGAFALSCGVNNGSGAPVGTVIAVPQGGAILLRSDGTNVTKSINLIGQGAAANGANTDITSLAGLTTPLTIGQGGTGNTVGQPSGAAGGALAGSYPSPTLAGAVRLLESAVIIGSGNFSIPDGATTSTIFKFTVIGGGGAGGGASTSSNYGGGGGSGGAGVVYFSGFTAAQNVAVVIGTGGIGSVGANGGDGGSTTIAYAANTVATSTGGVGGGVNGSTASKTGAAGSFSAAVGASGLILVSSYLNGPQNGSQKNSGDSTSGAGGGNPYGTGGISKYLSGGTSTGAPGISGSGGGGGVDFGASVAGGAGGNGFVLVEWVL